MVPPIRVLTLLAGSVLAVLALAVAPAQARLLVVPSPTSKDVRIVDAETLTQVGTPISTGALVPSRAVVSLDGATAYVTAYGFGGNGRLFRIDLATRDSSSVEVGDQPVGVALTPDGTRAYVANFGAQTISVIDVTATPMAVVTTIGPDPAQVGQVDSVAVSPDGAQAWVSSAFGVSGILRVDTATNTLLPRITIEGPIAAPRFLSIAPDGSALYAGIQPLVAGSRNGVQRIGTADPFSQSGIWAGSADVALLALSPDGDRVFSAHGLPDRVDVFSTATSGSLGSPLPATTPSPVYGIAADARSSRFWVVERGTGDGAQPDGVLRAHSATTGAPIGTASFVLPYLTDFVVPAPQPSQAPVAAFTVTPAAAGSPTTFDAAASTDPDGSVARYDWTFGDGATLADGGPTPSHTYGAAGTYTVTLRVTDVDGTSTSTVFTGQQGLRNGGPSAETTRSAVVPAAPAPPNGGGGGGTPAPPGGGGEPAPVPGGGPAPDPGTTPPGSPPVAGPPAPGGTPVPTLRLGRLTLARAVRSVTVPVRCSATCTGTVVVRAGRSARGRVVGRAAVRGAAGVTRRVTVPIRPADSARVRRAGALRVDVRVRATNRTLAASATRRVR